MINTLRNLPQLIMGFACKFDAKTVVVSCATEDLMPRSDNSIGTEQRLSGELMLGTILAPSEATGIWRRYDKLINCGGRALTIETPRATLAVPNATGRAKVYRSSWCAEAQAEIVIAGTTAVVVGSQGRSCSGYAPHIEIETEAGWLILDLLPCGDWRSEMSHSEEGMLIAYGHYDADTVIPISAGESCVFGVECLVRYCEQVQPAETVWQIQRYAEGNLAKRFRRTLPVVYNTWFDQFASISIEGMTQQLEAAHEIGCEGFIIDAGWFGPNGASWANVGDWRENPRVFSGTDMESFADQVRAKEMLFGIWMEPERVHPNAPARVTHPEWFIPAGSNFYPDLTQKAAYDWVLSEVVRVIDSYQVGWLKVDCNHDFSTDPYHWGHYARMHKWFELLDEVAYHFPNLVLEGCASGGLRNDLLANAHFHTHFLSDTVDPIDTIRIGMSASAWLAPRMTSKWLVVYPTGNGWTPYESAPRDTGDLVLCPALATSEKVSSYHLDFAARAAMPGAMAISGNIAGLSDALKQQLGEHISFYKKHSMFIQNAVALPLTPCEPLANRTGWAAIQLSTPDFHKHLVFIYNIASSDDSMNLRMLGLDENRQFMVKDEAGNSIAGPRAGQKFMQTGLYVECKSGHARVLQVEEI
jgi:alpha-galactosidase